MIADRILQKLSKPTWLTVLVLTLCLLFTTRGHVSNSPPPVRQSVDGWRWQPDYDLGEGDFTIVVMPDTQYYAQSYPRINMIQTHWIASHQKALNIVYVAHVGDLVDLYGYHEGRHNKAAWDNADEAMQILEAAAIPYGIAAGNHDYDHYDKEARLLQGSRVYNAYFGVERFRHHATANYGGHYGQNNNNNYMLFSAGGDDFIVLNIAYDGRYQEMDVEDIPDKRTLMREYPVLQWADERLKTHSQRRAIIVCHSLLKPGGMLSRQGAAVYKVLSSHPNLFLMLCGHESLAKGIPVENRRSDGRIDILLSNYQDLDSGGNGWLRVMTFSAQRNTIFVRTYSPWMDWNDRKPHERTGHQSRFELAYNKGASIKKAALAPSPINP